MPNGKYEITITDGEGNISTLQINFSKRPLSFAYSKVDNYLDISMSFENYERFIC